MSKRVPEEENWECFVIEDTTFSIPNPGEDVSAWGGKFAIIDRNEQEILIKTTEDNSILLLEEDEGWIWTLTEEEKEIIGVGDYRWYFKRLDSNLIIARGRAELLKV